MDIVGISLTSLKIFLSLPLHFQGDLVTLTTVMMKMRIDDDDQSTAECQEENTSFVPTRYFALNKVMRFRALQIGRIYKNQHPKEMLLSVEELREMIGHKGESLCNHLLHSATSLRCNGGLFSKSANYLSYT